MLTDQCKSVFTTPKDIPVVSLKPAKNGNSPSEITITDKDIKEAIDDMVITSTPGPRRYHGQYLQRICRSTYLPIKKTWQASLESGKLPDGTAQEITTPTYKGGVKSNPVKYWQVALTNHLTKIFERILKKINGRIP